jgi:hypothetical protein
MASYGDGGKVYWRQEEEEEEEEEEEGDAGEGIRGCYGDELDDEELLAYDSMYGAAMDDLGD